MTAIRFQTKTRGAQTVYTLAALFGILTLSITPADAQQGLTLVVGRLVTASGILQQNISVKNATSSLVQEVMVECGFFNQAQLIAISSVHLENIAPGAVGYKPVVAKVDTTADHTECRIVGAH